MAIFIIIGIICDLTLNYYNQMIENGFSVVLIEFLVVFSYGIYFYYIKYMMEVLYYPYWKICLCIGLSLLCLNELYLLVYFSNFSHIDISNFARSDIML